MSGDDRFLAGDHALVRALAEPDERILPPLDVVDWWEHPGEEGRTTSTGLVGVGRQLAVTTQRLLVLRDGTIERSVALASIGGARLLGPTDFPIEDSERASWCGLGVNSQVYGGVGQRRRLRPIG
jgi:hypothetical protein